LLVVAVGHKYALIVPYVSISWPEDGQEWPKHVATIINKLITKYIVIEFDSKNQQFVYLVNLSTTGCPV
jgi:hypothetical protein